MENSKLENMLKMCSDSSLMQGWNDALEMYVEKVDRYVSAQLSDDDLCMLAAGVQNPLNTQIKKSDSKKD
jgi:hypothetical protein